MSFLLLRERICIVNNKHVAETIFFLLSRLLEHVNDYSVRSTLKTSKRIGDTLAGTVFCLSIMDKLLSSMRA